MYLLKLIKNEDKYYKYIDCVSLEAYILYLFLTSDVRFSNADFYSNLAYYTEFIGGCGNAPCIEKEDGDISLCYEVDIREEEDEGKAVWFKIPISQFVALPGTWPDEMSIKASSRSNYSSGYS